MHTHRTITHTFAILGLTVAAAGCPTSGPPNEALRVLHCDEGYVINNSRSACEEIASLILLGIVENCEDDQPVPGVEVIGHPTHEGSVMTDENGFFQMSYLSNDNVHMIYKKAGYEIQYRTVGDTTTPTGFRTINASTCVQPLGDIFTVAGTVYALDAPAAGATVHLRPGNDYNQFTTTTDANGRFSFPNINGYYNYTLRVPPYDEDGDGIHDYRYLTFGLGTLDTQTTYNLSNLALSLTSIGRRIEYVNLVPNLGTIAGPTTVGGPGNRLINPTSNLLLHFGHEVDIATADVQLLNYEAAGGVGDEIAITATWSSNDTLLTIDPMVDLTADARPETLYEIRINALHWTDGQFLVNQTDPNAMIRIRFDVSSAPTLLASPTPAFYTDNRINANQAATSVLCDADNCWIFDSDGYFFGGYGDPLSGGAISSAFNLASGLELVWPRVDGASSYRVYARQRNNNNTLFNRANWYLTSTITGGFGDPNANAFVYGSGIMAGGGTGDWGFFDVTGGGPMMFGTQIDVVVTAVDIDGFESPIDPSMALTFSDQTSAAVRGAQLNHNAGGLQVLTTELGQGAIRRIFRIYWSEFMDTSVAPQLEAISGNIRNFSDAANFSWDAAGNVLIPENISDRVVLGPVEFDVRGGCSPITCDAIATADPNTSDDSVCVADPTLFSNGDVFFLEDTGVFRHGALNIASVDNTAGVVFFSTEFTSTLTVGGNDIFACAHAPGMGNRALMAAAPGATDTTISVSNARVFYPNEAVVFFDTNGDDMHVTTVENVNTRDNELTLNTIPTWSNFTPASTAIIARPLGTEYALRNVSNLTVRDDVTAGSGTATIDVTGTSLKNSTCMAGDLAMVDADGILNTFGDRYFGLINDIVMIDDDPMTAGIDEDEFTLDLGAPPDPSMPSLANGTLIVHDQSLVMCLGDSFRITNGDSTAATSMIDTSGNNGILPARDQFSPCAGTPGCTIVGTGDNLFVF